MNTCGDMTHSFLLFSFVNLPSFTKHEWVYRCRFIEYRLVLAVRSDSIMPMSGICVMTMSSI